MLGGFLGNFILASSRSFRYAAVLRENFPRIRLSTAKK